MFPKKKRFDEVRSFYNGSSVRTWNQMNVTNLDVSSVEHWTCVLSTNPRGAWLS